MRFSSYFWSKSGGTRVLWGVLSPNKSTARMGDGSRPKMPERTCAPPKKSKANSPRTRDHSRNCSTRSGSRAGKIGLSNSRFRLRRNFRELSNPIFRLSSRSGSSSFARDHLRVWGIRRNIFEYVDVLEQEKAIGIKKKSHFFSGHIAELWPQFDPLWSRRASRGKSGSVGE